MNPDSEDSEIDAKNIRNLITELELKINHTKASLNKKQLLKMRC